MNLIVLVWSMAASACLTLGCVFGLIWWKERRQTVGYLIFAVAATASACLTLLEMQVQFLQSTETYGRILQWAHVPMWVLILCLIGMARFYLKSGRPWLAWTNVGLRTLALILNFAFPPNLNFREITALGRITFLGESSHYPVGVANPLMAVGLLSLAFLIAFIFDASVSLWRRGDRQQAVTFGGVTIFMILASVVHGLLVMAGVLHTPVMTSFYFSGIIIIMGVELSHLVAKSGRVARELQESQLKVQLAKSIAKIGLWTWNLAEGKLVLSAGDRSLHGLPAQGEITIESFLGAFVPEDRPAIRQELLGASRRHAEFRSEGRVALTDGTTRWLDLHGKIVPEEGRDPQIMTGISLDITARKESEIVLRQALTFSQSVLDSLPSNIVVLDRTGVIVLQNQQWKGFTQANGGNPDRCGLGANYLTVCQAAAATGDYTAQEALAGIRAVLAGTRSGFEFEYPCDSSNEARWFLLRVVPLISPDGDGGVVVSHSDITTFRQAIREKEQLRNELEHTGRVSLLGELSGSLAHELSQPLTAILANAQAAKRRIAADQPDLEAIKPVLLAVIEEVKRAAQIVHRVRALARKETPPHELLNANQLVQESVALLQGNLTATDLTLTLDLAPVLPQVPGGVIELQQVVLNLLINALQAMETMPPNRRSLTVTTRATNERILIAVRDSGPGLSPETMPRLFEAFYTTKRSGLGLGLAFCRRIAESYGGSVSAENHPDGGAVFTLALPFQP